MGTISLKASQSTGGRPGRDPGRINCQGPGFRRMSSQAKATTILNVLLLRPVDFQRAYSFCTEFSKKAGVTFNGLSTLPIGNPARVVETLWFSVETPQINEVVGAVTGELGLDQVGIDYLVTLNPGVQFVSKPAPPGITN